MPSWELPAIRMTASEMLDTLGPAPEAEMVASLMRDNLQTVHTDKNCDFNRQRWPSSVAQFSLALTPFMSNSYLGVYQPELERVRRIGESKPTPIWKHDKGH